MIKTPELDKMAKVREQSQAQGSFLDWLFNRGYVRRTAKLRGSIESVLAEYHYIDLDKVDEEQRALLDEIRAKK